MKKVKCVCGSGETCFRVVDAEGVTVLYACDSCRDKRLAKYGPEFAKGCTDRKAGK